MRIICVDCERISDDGDERAVKWEYGDWVPYGDTQAQLPGHWVCARCGGELEDYTEEDEE